MHAKHQAQIDLAVEASTDSPHNERIRYSKHVYQHLIRAHNKLEYVKENNWAANYDTSHDVHFVYLSLISLVSFFVHFEIFNSKWTLIIDKCEKYGTFESPRTDKDEGKREFNDCYTLKEILDNYITEHNFFSFVEVVMCHDIGYIDVCGALNDSCSEQEHCNDVRSLRQVRDPHISSVLDMHVAYYCKYQQSHYRSKSRLKFN